MSYFDDYEDSGTQSGNDYSPKSGAYYIREKVIYSGNRIRLGKTNPFEELHSIFGKGNVKCCKSITHFDFECKAIVYETLPDMEKEKTTYDLYSSEEETSINLQCLAIPNSKQPCEVIKSEPISENEDSKRHFLSRLFKVKSTLFPVFHIDGYESYHPEYIMFDGMYELYKIESALTQSIIMKKMDDEFYIQYN